MYANDQGYLVICTRCAQELTYEVERVPYDRSITNL